ncbi:MAG: type I phosphomannose isomerase catalytic subunit [Myxococcota bacterium]
MSGASVLPALPLLPMSPLLKERLWGGHRLAQQLRKAPVDDLRPLGESWEVADLDEGASVVAHGPCEGQTLSALVARFGAALIGTGAPPGRFPLLVKVIDADDDLSVQVHPGPDDLARLPGARSKDESWLILDRDDDARLLHGFVDGVTAASFAAAVRAGTPHTLLREVRVAPGDVVRVSPGTFHAIGKGTLLLEVQEPSDTTYRVWDFGRTGPDGKPRALHIDEALTVARFGQQPAATETPTRLADGHELLVDAERYRMERLHLAPNDSRSLRFSPRTALVVIPTEGEVALAPGEGPSTRAGHLETVVVPAALETLEVQAGREGATLVIAGLGGASLVEVA